MGNASLCDDLLYDILCKLSQKDLVKCKMVSKSWHQIISHVWLRRFWSQSPVVGLFFRTLHSPELAGTLTDHRINYIFVRDYPFLNASQLDMYKLCRFQERDTSDNHLDCCNGLILLFNPCSYQLCVFNPITKQHVSIPKACVHENEQFCAVLAFDPLESNHLRVVRIDYSQQTSTSTLLDMDIFSSKTRQWVRHGLQLNQMFIEGFKTFKLCRHFVYLRGVLYSLTSSRELLCIDLNTIKACSFDLPDHVLEEDDKIKDDDTTLMGCLGISRGLICYVKVDSSHTYRFWSYDDRQCPSGSGVGQWTLRYSVSVKQFEWKVIRLLHGREYYDSRVWSFGLKDPAKPYAISPNSHVFFFGQLGCGSAVTISKVERWNLSMQKEVVE